MGKATCPPSRDQYSHHLGREQLHQLAGELEGQLVVISHDQPFELVFSLPTLYCKMVISYHIVKGKARLVCLVHRKTHTTVVFTQVSSEDKSALPKQLSE